MTSGIDQVKEALDKGWPIAEELLAAQEEARQARATYNELRAAQSSQALASQRDKELEEVGRTTSAAYQKEVAAAQSKLDKAKQDYDKTTAASLATRNKVLADATSEWDKRLQQHQRELDLQAAGAQAEAHRADQRVTVVQARLTRFCEQTKQQLGIDLAAFLDKGE